MKQLILFLSVLVAFSCKKNDNPEPPNPMSEVGWAVGKNSDYSKPLILKTEDGAKTWKEQKLGAQFDNMNITLSRVKAYNDNICWILGNDNDYNIYIFKTTDGGKNWKRVGEDLAIQGGLSDMVTYDGNNLLAIVSANNYIIKSNDAGETWRKEKIEIDEGLFFRTQCLTSNDDHSILVSSGELCSKQSGEMTVSALYMSVDGGQSWKFKRIETNEGATPFISVTMPSKNTVFVSGDYVYKSTDTGDSFQKIYKYSRGHFNCIYAINEQTIWSAYDPTAILYSKNGGNTWAKGNFEDEESGKCLNRILFINNNTIGIAVGGSQSPSLKGLILVSRDSGLNWHKAKDDNNGFFEDVSFVQVRRR